jgi:hypothetical protein
VLTFLLVTATGPDPLPAPVVARAERLDDRLLLHHPDRRDIVRSERSIVRVWQTTDPTGWRQWRREGSGLAALSGWAWATDGGAPDLDWLADVAGGALDPEAAAAGRSGSFALLHADVERGSATVVADPLGTALLYVAHGDGFLAVSTRVDVCAAMLADEAWPTGRDADAMAWMPALTFFADDRTSYRDVRVLPASAVVRVDAAGCRIDERTPPWLDLDDAPDIDDVADRLVRLVRSAASHPVEHRRFMLSGGRDSRTVLAAAAEAGCLDAFEVVTLGYEHHPDVLAAQQVADRLGVRLQRVEPSSRELNEGSFPRLAARHVGLTSGMFGLWDLKQPHAVWSLRLNGLGGGAMNPVYAPLTRDADDVDGLTHELLGNVRFDAGGLLRPEVATDLRRRVSSWVAARLEAGATPALLSDLFFLEFRSRRWAGAAQEANTFGAHLSGLVDPRIVRAFLAQPLEDRASGWVSLELLRALRPDLATLPLANRGWGEACVRRLPEVGVPPITSSDSDPPADWHDTQWDAVLPHFRQRLLEEVNPGVRNLVRAEAVEELLDRYPRVDAYAKTQLWAAASAAIWTSGTDRHVSFPPDDADVVTGWEVLEQERDELQEDLATTRAALERRDAELASLRDRKVVRAGLAVADTLGGLARWRGS